MTAKELMEDVRKAEKEIKIIAAKKRHYAELATSIGVNLSGMPGSKAPKSRVEEGAIGIVDLITELDVKEKEFTSLVLKAEKLIGRLKQENFRKVLSLYYLAGLSMKSVNDEMGYKDEKSAYRCRGYALRELQKLM